MRFNRTGPVNTVDWLTSTLILAQPFFDVRRSMFTSYVFCLHRSIVFSYFVSVESDRKCHWNENLATKSNGAKRERNWTDLETEAFCDILADPEFSFSTTLETKVLKKQANKEVFEEIRIHLKTSSEDPGFPDTGLILTKLQKRNFPSIIFETSTMIWRNRRVKSWTPIYTYLT